MNFKYEIYESVLIKFPKSLTMHQRIPNIYYILNRETYKHVFHALIHIFKLSIKIRKVRKSVAKGSETL